MNLIFIVSQSIQNILKKNRGLETSGSGRNKCEKYFCKGKDDSI